MEDVSQTVDTAKQVELTKKFSLEASKGKDFSKHLGQIQPSSVWLQLKYSSASLHNFCGSHHTYLTEKAILVRLNWLTACGTGIRPGIGATSPQSNKRICAHKCVLISVAKVSVFCYNRG